MDEPVCVQSFYTRSDADLAKAALAVQGIEAIVYGDDTGVAGFYSWVTSTQFIQLLGASADVQEASRVLRSEKP